MVFKRKIYDKLKQWKELSGGSSAVLLEGARRIGKSTIVEEFARNEYDDYMILDFAKEGKDIKNNFTENMDDLDTFFRNLFLLKGRSLEGERCVIIFDEVQLFPQARQAIKYLVADGRYEYMETGSLISIRKNVTNILIPSEEYRIKMYPMDFEEYLWATGDNVTFEAMQSAFQHRKPLGDAIHRKIMQKFRTYMVVGGMPQAVNAFVEGKTFAQIDFIKRNILSLYEEDLAKYDTENREKASVIFKTIPEQLENKNSHFRFSQYKKKCDLQVMKLVRELDSALNTAMEEIESTESQEENITDAMRYLMQNDKMPFVSVDDGENMSITIASKKGTVLWKNNSDDETMPKKGGHIEVDELVSDSYDEECGEYIFVYTKSVEKIWQKV